MSDNLLFVREGDDSAGATVWWRLHGDIKRDDLVAQLGLLSWEVREPTLHEPEVALRRAVAVLRGKRRLIRPVRKGVWAVVGEAVVPSRDELRHWNGPIVTLSKIGRPSMANGTVEEAVEVCEAYDYHLGALTTEDVSAWLIEIIEQLGGVSLRDGGGIYYLPPASMSKWRDISSTLTTITGGTASVYVVPTVRMTTDGARAILDSLLAELTAEVASIRTETISGELGVRALETRAERATALSTKVNQYGALLDNPMQQALVMLGDLQVDIASAKLAAEAVAEEARKGR